jgi:hypothetical protein
MVNATGQQPKRRSGDPQVARDDHRDVVEAAHGNGQSGSGG